MISCYNKLWLVLILSVTGILGKPGFGPTDQEWGYVTVRDGAHMFYWLHYTTADVKNPLEKPLIIWLQGGPGWSSTGYGNLGEIGPINEFSQERDYAWTKDYNVLFVDNPVGSGFSYVDFESALVQNNTQIADDFLVFLKGFYEELPQFKNIPVYIFGESYAGKMIVEIALELYEAQKNGKIESNIKGVGLGDSWISPVDTILTWGPYLLNQGLVDNVGFNMIQEGAEKIVEAISSNEFANAADLWLNLEQIVEEASFGTDFYNVLTKAVVQENRRMLKTSKSIKAVDFEQLYKVMNENVTKALGLEREWLFQNINVFYGLKSDFMKPTINIVEKLLNETDLEVAVYNGQLDLIIDTPGTINWVNKLKWAGSEKWNTILHDPIVVNNTIEGFYKKIGKFTFYWVSRAGHMVPCDNPEAMNFILNNTINV